MNSAVNSSFLSEPMIRQPWSADYLNPFPIMAVRLLQTLSAEDVEIPEVSKVIKSDPAFAAELLRAANSPLFGHSYQIANVERATTALGLARITKLAVTIALRTYLRNALTTDIAIRCWHHSLATALIASELASQFEQQPDNAYTAGLIHDIGRLAFLQAFPSGYSLMLEECHKRHIDILEAERAMLGSDHCMAGMWISSEWRLPTETYRVIWDHHEFPNDGDITLTALVHTACGLASRLGLGIFPVEMSKEDIIHPAPKHVRGYLESHIDEMGPKVHEKVQSLAQ